MFKHFVSLVLLTLSVPLLAQIPPPPDPPRLVVDLAKVMSEQEANTLEQKLRAYRDSTSTEITVVTVANLGGYDVNDFAYRLGESWGVGQKGKNNGIVVLVSIEDHKAAIATGYGMEGAVTDASTRKIRQDYMSPNFRNGNFYAGLDQATTVIMKLASGEFTNENFGKKSGKGGRGIFSLLFVLAIVLFPILSSIGRARRNHFGSKGVDFWTAFWLMSHMGGGRHRNDNWGGGSGWGGGGGSDFGGFGGGSFGGGGSGGDW